MRLRKVYKKKNNSYQHQWDPSYNERAIISTSKNQKTLDSDSYLSIAHDIDTSQILKSLQHIEMTHFQYANKILNHIVSEGARKTWLDYFDLLKTRFSWVYTHSVNVAMISVMMAADLGYDNEKLECIALGGLLHDVGKLLIPTSIIQKDSSLDDMQMTLMRKHSELGVSLMADCGLNDDCVAMILQHHERLDGSGYPFGLKSDSIHPYAKIAMIADVLDAITSHRPYRPGKSASEAILIIKDEGRKYCTEYVSVIERLVCEHAK